MRVLIGAVSGYVSDENIWVQERQVIEGNSITDKTGETWRTMYVSLRNDLDTEIARYAVDENKHVLIDISDVLRTLAAVDGLGYQITLSVKAYYSVSDTYSAAQSITFTPRGLVSPERLFIPATKEAHTLTTETAVNNANAFAFPNKVIRGEDVVALFVYGVSGVGYKWTLDGSTWVTSENTITAITAPKVVAFPANTKAVALTYNGVEYKRTFVDQECGKRYARVSWIPAFGSESLKRAYFELRAETVQAGVTILQPNTPGDWYRDIRSRGDVVVLTLTGLTQYDVWYYSDIITSLRVEVDGFGRVEIQTKEITLPDGESGTFDLKIKCKLAEYDAVAL